MWAEIRSQLVEQQKCLEQQTDMRVQLLQDLQDFFRKKAEIESEYSRNLEKLAERFMAKTRSTKDHQQYKWVCVTEREPECECTWMIQESFSRNKSVANRLVQVLISFPFIHLQIISPSLFCLTVVCSGLERRLEYFTHDALQLHAWKIRDGRGKAIAVSAVVIVLVCVCVCVCVCVWASVYLLSH